MDGKWTKAQEKELRRLSSHISSSSSPSKHPSLLRSSSVSTAPNTTTSSSTKAPLFRSFSQKGGSISRKCGSLAREQKSRFYIMRRCVAMLARWNKHNRDP